MTDVLIAADDLTGANAAAVGLRRLGAVTLHATVDPERIAQFAADYRVVSVTTDSRHLPAADAAAATSAVVEAGWPAQLLSSRCDSTLRGNVGAEAAAVLASARRLLMARDIGESAAPRPVIGLCMPAFPGADRQTIHGLQTMGGVPLEDTELAHDVRSPITDSSVDTALRSGAAEVLGHEPRIVHVDVDDIDAGPEALAQRLRDLLTPGALPDFIVADARTDADLLAVARAAVAAAPEALFVGIDPGPGTRALAQALGLLQTSGTVLAVSGSATELTRTQLARLREHRSTTAVRPVYLPDRPSHDPRIDVAATAAAVLEAWRERPEVLLLATVLEESDLLEGLDPRASDALTESLGAVTAQVLARAQDSIGLYTTGGDVTTAVLGALTAAGIAVDFEVLPLATAGRIVGGPHAGLPIVTKGGLVGDESAAGMCIDALYSLNTHR
ncbi:four-carbon acid sugar kinase family protein [Brevibacterium sp. 91QC2O2]|uniref:four-carbon acid sugar kinase family protein n=1 Tax=Brevibacterium sp. 91QC2O2 TaxID=2968458 RepID=UPI00211D156C|nr:four-carbon acid sugar kinase family protein [Brevibacterium sp. 91QC2O2]MCQ9367179.1 four-carbon acid sugar kinase family protein [Brevibacterium sp. 91QC2O2]